MVKFIILRHGYSVTNKEKRFTGQMDVSLDEVGYRQAKSTADYILENFETDSIYSSDLIRAYDTVKPIADALGIEVHKRRDLRETDVGKWQGMLIEDVKKEYPESFAFYKENPGLTQFEGGECYADVVRRAKNAIEEIAKENDGKTVLIGTHGGVVRALLIAWGNVSLDSMNDVPTVPNASVTTAEYENGTMKWCNIGYTDHLIDKTTEEGIKNL